MVSTQLLDAAIDQFGRLGFEGASTREIARAGGTAMSSITYHFGGKKGLYLAAAEHIARCIAERQAPVFAAAQAAMHKDEAAAREAVLAMLDSMALMMLSPETEPWSRFIIREQQYPTEAFDRIFEGAMQPMIEGFLMLVARLRSDLDERDARATAVMLFGQVLVLRAGRESVRRILGVERLDAEAAAVLRARMRATALITLQRSEA